jgi:hypothetical protein
MKFQDVKPASGSALNTKAMFEQGNVSNVSSNKEQDAEDGIPSRGLASKTRAQFEKGPVSNVSSSHGDYDDNRPGTGSASKTKALFEQGKSLRQQGKIMRENKMFIFSNFNLSAPKD